MGLVGGVALGGRVVAFMLYPPESSLLLASLLSAHGAAADEVHDGPQDNGPQQRDQQRRQAKIALIDGAHPKQRGEQKPCQQGSNHPHNDIQYDPLLRIRVHNFAGDPPNSPPTLNQIIKFITMLLSSSSASLLG